MAEQRPARRGESVSLRAELALDALEMAIWARGDPLPELVHHSDRGSQFALIPRACRGGHLSDCCPKRTRSLL